MSIIEKIETGVPSPTQNDCAFLWLYCMDGQPYSKYLSGKAPRLMPMVLVALRWDGAFGTMGGKVDPGETLRRALAREACEEADFWLSSSEELEPLGTYRDGDWHVHSYATQVSYDELLEARAKAVKVSQRSPECAGWCIVPTMDYPMEGTVSRGVSAFLLNNFRSTARLEFLELVTLIRSKN